MIRFENVTKRYGEKSEIILDQVSFHIFPGQLTWIMGESGAGKTTVFRLLLREIEPDQGKIWVNGRDISKLNKTQLAAYRRDMGFVFQDYKLIEDKNVYDNVAIKKIVAGARENDIRTQVASTLKLVGMEHKFDESICNLSGGEMQRVGIARAMIGNPSLVLADEPTGNLDPENTQVIMGLLQKINGLGATVVVVTHNHEIVKSAPGRKLWIEKGRVYEK